MPTQQYNLIDGGWTIAQDERGYTLSAQVYTETVPDAWPKRGDAIILPPAGFSGYKLDTVEIMPVSSAGPWILTLTARVNLGYNTTGGSSRTDERRVHVEHRHCKVKKSQLASWPSRLDQNADSDMTTLDFAVIDYFEAITTAVDLALPKSGIVTNIPSWCDIPNTSGRWRIFSARLEKVYDYNGTSTLKHVMLELAGLPSSLNTTWSTSRYPTVSFASI